MCLYCPRKETHGECLILAQCSALTYRFLRDGIDEAPAKIALLIAVLRRILPEDSASGRRSDRIDRWRAVALQRAPWGVRMEAGRLAHDRLIKANADMIDTENLVVGIDCPKLDAMIAAQRKGGVW